MGLLAKVRRAVRHVTKKERRDDKKSTKAAVDQPGSSEKTKETKKAALPTSDCSSTGCAESAGTSATSRLSLNGEKPTREPVSVETVAAFFSHYRDTSEDSILAEGMERLCSDMQVDPTDVRMLALAWRFGAVAMCRFARPEFVDGCLSLSVDSAPALRDALDVVLQEGKRAYRDLYKFTFTFGLEDGERCLPRDMAIALWQLVMPACGDEANKFTADWCRFLVESGVRGVTRDCWMVYLEFCHVVDADFANYSDEDAWPSLLDEFVEEQRRKASRPCGTEAERVESDE